LRGFDHNVPEAAKAFRKHLAVRRERRLDAIRESLVAEWSGRFWELRLEALPHGKLVCSYMPEVMIFAVSKTGDPVSLGFWGKGRPADFIKDVPDWRESFMKYFLYCAEAKALLLEEASRAQGRLVHFVSVFDLEDWSVIGNSHRAWTKFCTEKTGPVGQTYHDINAYFFTVRTTRMANMAYSIVKPLLPKKVTEKVFLLGDDFSTSQQLCAVLDEHAMASLRAGFAAAIPRRQCGRVAIGPREAFRLRVELPRGAALRWSFGVEPGECLGRFGCRDITFSLASCRASGSSGPEAFIRGLEPQKMEGTSIQGSIQQSELGEDSSPVVEFCWENRTGLLVSRMLCYAIEVEVPPAPVLAEVATATRPMVVLVVSLLALGIGVLLRISSVTV